MEGRREDGVVNVILRREVCFVPKIRDDGNSDEGEPSLACRIGSWRSNNAIIMTDAWVVAACRGR